MTSRRQRFRLPVVALALLSAAGCGDRGEAIAPVRGRVTLNGQPLTSGQVITRPADGRPATGAIGADGAFELVTPGLGDGAVVGTHAVAVIAYENSSNPDPEAPRGKPLVPERYAAHETSQLSIDVKANQPNEPVLNLKNP